MSNGDRSLEHSLRAIVICIGVVVAAMVIQAAVSNYTKLKETYAGYQRNAEEDQAEATKSIQDDCIGIAPAPSVACIENHLSAYYQKQATKADLEAQQDMAYWAYLMFLTSLFGVFVGIGGIVYVRLTLREARETTRIGQNGLKLVTENSEKELRAYVYSEDVFGKRRFTEACHVLEILEPIEDIIQEQASDHPIGFQVFGNINQST